MLPRPAVWLGLFPKKILHFYRGVEIFVAFLAMAACSRAAAATISSFSPSFGQPGNIIIVNGSGFTSASAIEFNSQTFADFNVISDNRISLIIPIGATSGPLSVTANGSTSTSASNFLVAPNITGFTPASGASPTQISISGQNFVVGGTSVKFAGTNAAVNGTVVASTQVNAVVPAGAVDGPITVTTSAGSANTTSNFIVSKAPLVSGFSPVAGTNGTLVVINGANFITNGTTVKFGNAVASQVVVVAASQVNAMVPSGTATGPITITTQNGTFTTTSNYTVNAAGSPTINDFSPTIGAAGTLVTLDGFNFTGTTSLTFGGVAVSPATFTVFNAAEIQMPVPSGATSGPITIHNPQGSFTTSSNFVTGSGPIITDFSPTSGSEGTQVIIDGLNLANVTMVKFVNAAVAVKPAASTQIILQVPTAAASGPITVVTPSAQFTTSSNFVVTSTGPFISSFSPSNGVRGMTVTITGGNFTNLANPAVEFNGVPGTITTPTTTTMLQATVPANATTGPITVRGQNNSFTSAGFFYLQPWITNFTPAAAPADATLTINGRNLAGATALTINGVSYNFTGTATQIVAMIPTNATSGLVSIVTPGGIVISTNIFAVLPDIYSFTPALGPVGTTVTITGTSLFNVTNVQFNGASAAPINVSAGQLQAVVPPGAASGAIQVFTPYGAAASSNIFTVTTESDLLLTKTATPPLSLGTSNVTYNLILTNEGPSIATGVVVTDYFPASVTFVSASTTAGVIGFTNGVVVCNIGVLTTNASVAMTIQGIETVAGTITNTASVYSAEGNLNPFLGFASAATTLISPAQGKLSISRISNSPAVIVSWPVSPANFLLQTNSVLGLANGWSNSVLIPLTTNGVNYVTNNISPQSVFFRLKSP
jgi:hypothetical protein